MNTLSFIRENSRFLGFGLGLMVLSNFGQTFYISLYGAHIRAAFSLSHTEFGLAYSSATLTSALILAWLGRRIDDIDLRLYAVLLAVGLAAAAGVLSWANSIPALALALLGLRLCGQGLMTHAAMTTMGRYFDRQRGRAMSFAGLGMPLGEALFPMAAVAAMASIGWRQAWAASALLIACVGLPLLLWLLQGHGARDARLKSKILEPQDTLRASVRQWTRREVLGDRNFHLVLPGALMPPFVLTGLFFHQAALAAAKGWPLSWLASAFVVYAMVHIIGSVGAGFLVDRFGALRLLVYYQMPLLAGLIGLGSVDAPWVAVFYLALAALTTGASGVVVNALWAESYGISHLGSIKAMTSSMMVFATAISPVALGWMLDAGISINRIVLFTAFAVGASIGLFMLRRYRQA